jgi:uncharacterized membrane protein HdeD (DUF308 family)
MTSAAKRDLSPFAAAFLGAFVASLGGEVLYLALRNLYYLWMVLGAAALLLGVRGVFRSLRRAQQQRPSMLLEAVGAAVMGFIASGVAIVVVLLLGFLQGPYPFG